MCIVDFQIQKPHQTSKAHVYGHRLIDSHVSFRDTYLHPYNYFGRVLTSDCSLFCRFGGHKHGKSINEGVETMFGLVECDNDKDCTDLEVVFLALCRFNLFQTIDLYPLFLVRPVKNSNVGCARLLRVMLERFEELSRVAIFAMKARYEVDVNTAQYFECESS
jgi:hypothetical protein